MAKFKAATQAKTDAEYQNIMPKPKQIATKEAIYRELFWNRITEIS
jgi:hypothetical protein